MAIAQTGFRKPSQTPTITYPGDININLIDQLGLCGVGAAATTLPIQSLFFLKGFDLSDIPPDATIEKIQCRITRRAINGIDLPYNPSATSEETFNFADNPNSFGRIKVNLGANTSDFGTSDNGIVFLSSLNEDQQPPFSNTEFKTVIHDIDLGPFGSFLNTSHFLIPNNIFLKIQTVASAPGGVGSPISISNGPSESGTNEVQIALNVVYSTGTKLKIKGQNSIILGRPSSNTTFFQTLAFDIGATNVLKTPNSGVLNFNDSMDEGFFGNAIKFSLNSLSPNDVIQTIVPSTIVPEANNLSQINDILDFIKVTIVYNFANNVGFNTNSFKAGFSLSPNASNFDIQSSGEEVVNLETNQGSTTATHTFTLAINDLISLYQSNLTAQTTMVFLLSFLNFVIRYEDDNPDNTLKIFGQNFSSPSSPTGITQVSPLVEISYNDGSIPTKVKISGNTKVILK